jgi:hypothetical protein
MDDDVDLTVAAVNGCLFRADRNDDGGGGGKDSSKSETGKSSKPGGGGGSPKASADVSSKLLGDGATIWNVVNVVVDDVVWNFESGCCFDQRPSDSGLILGGPGLENVVVDDDANSCGGGGGRSIMSLSMFSPLLLPLLFDVQRWTSSTAF